MYQISKKLKNSFVLLLIAYPFLASPAVIDFVCKPGGQESPAQTVRNFFFMSMGFSTDEQYKCFADFDSSGTIGDSTSESNLVTAIGGQSGLIGKIDSLRTYVKNAIVAGDSTIRTCSDVPTSGTINVNGSETITFANPTRTPPADYPITTTYTKSVTYTNTNSASTHFGTVIFEFHCDRNSMMAKYTKDIDKDATDDQFVALFIDTETNTRYIDFYMHDDSNINSDTINLTVRLQVDTVAKTFDMWLTRSGLSATNEYSAYRFVSKANYETQEATLFWHDVSNEGLTNANYTSATDIDSIDVVTAIAPNAGNSGDQKKTCMPNFSTSASTQATSADCAGLSLFESNAFQFAGSKNSMQYIEQNLKTKLQAL